MCRAMRVTVPRRLELTMRDRNLRFNRLTWSVCAALLTSACSMAPTYERPTPVLGTSWPQVANMPATAPGVLASELTWQALYPDPRLQALIQHALTNNHDLRIAVARVAEARGLWGVQQADQLPNANLGLSRTGSRTPVGVANNAVPIEINRYDSGLSLLSFELDFWGRVANLSEAARANYVATEEDRRMVRMGLVSDVVNAYLQAQEMQERVSLARDTVDARSQTLSLVKKKRTLGAASDLEVHSAQGALATANADHMALERQRVQALNALTLLVGGQMPTDLPAPWRLADQNMSPRLVAEVPSDVLLRRPDVRAAEQGLMAANANIGAARAAFLPKMQLTGALGSASTSLSGLFQSGTRAWSFVPSLQAPLFDGGRTSANVDVAQARKVMAVAAYEKTLQTAFREVADLLVARETLLEQLNAQNANRRSQDERLRLVQARYQAGGANQLELLDAQRESFSAQQASVQVLRQLYSTTAMLYKALGGGDLS